MLRRVYARAEDPHDELLDKIQSWEIVNSLSRRNIFQDYGLVQACLLLLGWDISGKFLVNNFDDSKMQFTYYV
jgi:hypothetical protein